jgi:hypothetical protein
MNLSIALKQPNVFTYCGFANVLPPKFLDQAFMSQSSNAPLSSKILVSNESTSKRQSNKVFAKDLQIGKKECVAYSIAASPRCQTAA